MAPKRKRDNADITVYDIGNSTSSFGEKAEQFLNIKIRETDSFAEILSQDEVSYSIGDINQELRDLFLEHFDRDAIRVYKPQQHTAISKHAQTFLYKLSVVINNNYLQIEPEHVEDYIQDLMENVLRQAKFEDGTELILMPCMLKLFLGDEQFAAHSDKEGRRGTEIIWVVDEDKHKFDRRWKKGDVQLIANMIAAVQTNMSVLNEIYPKKMLGIKFDADRLYFYSISVTEDYLKELAGIKDNKSTIQLIVHKFPKGRELSLSFYNHRKEIFLYLSALRKYALALKPIYIE